MISLVDPVASLSPAQALEIAWAKAGYDATVYLDANPLLHYDFDPQTQRGRLVYIVEDIPQQMQLNRGDDDAQAVIALPEVLDDVIDAHSFELRAAVSQW